MSTQLRLVDSPRARRPRSSGGARTGRRSVRWPAWKLDERTRSVGRQGVAQARAALEQAARPGPRLPKAS